MSSRVRLVLTAVLLVLLAVSIYASLQLAYAKPRGGRGGRHQPAGAFRPRRHRLPRVVPGEPIAGGVRIRHVSGDYLDLKLPGLAVTPTITSREIDEYTRLVTADFGVLELRFHVRSISPRIKFDIVVKQDVVLQWSAFKRIVKQGRWTVDWQELANYRQGGRIVLPAGAFIDPLIEYDETTGTYVFDSAEDYAPVVLVNYPSDGSVKLSTPDSWYSGTVLPDWAIITHCNYMLDEEKQHIEYEFKLVDEVEEGEILILKDDTAWSFQQLGSGDINFTLVQTSDGKYGSADTIDSVYPGGLYSAWRLYSNLNNLDLRSYDFLCLWLYANFSKTYGGSTKAVYRITLYYSDLSNLTYYDTPPIDGGSGWNRIVIPLRNPVEKTVLDLDTILSSVARITIETWTNNGQYGVVKIDRVVAVRGIWVFLEFFVPDSYMGLEVYTWDGAGWVDATGNPGSFHVLNGLNFSAIYGPGKGLSLSVPVELGTNVTMWDWGDVEPALVNASSTYGALKRVVLPVKMPPLSTTTTINQARIKVRIRYADKPAIGLDGVDDHVRMPKLTPDEWTVEVVIKPLSHNPIHDCIFMFGDYASDSYVWWEADVDPKGFSMQVVIGGTRYMTRLSWRPELGKWYVLHFTRSLAGEHRIYVNGELELTGGDPGGPIDHDANPTAIGGDVARNEAYTSSDIALVRVYNRTLADSEVSDNSGNPYEPSNATGLVLWLDPRYFNGTHLLDRSGLGNHGRVYGGAQYKVWGEFGVKCTYRLPYGLPNPQLDHVASLLLEFYPYSVNIAPKLPPRNRTLWIIHPSTGYNITFRFNGSGSWPLLVAGNRSRVVPIDRLLRNSTVDVYVSETPAAYPLVWSLHGVNLTRAVAAVEHVGVSMGLRVETEGHGVVTIYAPWPDVYGLALYPNGTASNALFVQQHYFNVSASNVTFLHGVELLDDRVWLAVPDTQALESASIGPSELSAASPGRGDLFFVARLPPERVNATMLVGGEPAAVYKRSSGTELNRVSSEADVAALPDSWFYDPSTGTLYVHVRSYGSGDGFTASWSVSVSRPPVQPGRPPVPGAAEAVRRAVDGLARAAVSGAQWLYGVLADAFRTLAEYLQSIIRPPF